MRRREVTRGLLAASAGAALVAPAAAEAQSPPQRARTPAEAAAGVNPIDVSFPPGHVERYFANDTPGMTGANAGFAAAIAQARVVANGVPIGAPVAVSGAVSISASGGGVTIPGAQRGSLAVSLQMSSGFVNLDRGAVLKIEGDFFAPPRGCFGGAGEVVFVRGASVPELYPEWWGARADSAPGEHGTIGSAGTDCTSAIARCLAAAAGGSANGVGVFPIRFGPGYYLTGAQRIPVASTLRGAGREQSGFIARADTRGPWWQEAPLGAAKTIIEDLAFYCAYAASPRMSHGLRLGYESTASPHGTEGYLKGLWVRDCACFENGFQCDVKGNVGFYDLLSIYCNGLPQQSGLRITGTGNYCSNIVSMAPGRYGVFLNGIGIQVVGLEIEAPSSGAIALSIQQNARLAGVLFSLADDTQLDHVWELGPSATSWKLSGAQYVWGSKRNARVLRGNGMRADGSYLGGNATGDGNRAAPSAAPHGGDGEWSSENRAATPTLPVVSMPSAAAASVAAVSLAVASKADRSGADASGPDAWAALQLQSFALRIRNDSGTLQHRIGEPGGKPTRFAAAIKGASAWFAPTASGGNPGTSFVAGGRIGGAQRNVFWLDTVDQGAADVQGLAFVSFNSTGVALNVAAGVAAARIGEITRNRLNFQFTNAATGEPFELDAAHVPAGAELQVSWLGRLSD